jgi:hypothetical protein
MGVFYKSNVEKVVRVIEKSTKTVSPLLKTVEDLRSRNLEIAALDVDLEEEEKEIRRKRAELAAQELENTKVITGITKLFNLEEGL